MPTPARQLAYRILSGVETEGVPLAELLARGPMEALEERERAFLHELVMGTLRLRGSLDYALASVVLRPLDTLEPRVLWILRLGAHQILSLRVPDHAAVSESVALARSEAPRASGLVNAALRALARNGAPAPPDPQSSPLGWLTTAGSLPPWLAERWLARLGPELARKRAASLLEPSSRALRINPRSTGLAERLAGFGLAASRVPGGFVLETPPPRDLILEGEAYFQSEGSQLAAGLVPLSPLVWDCCAAPGGKALAIADRLGGFGRLLATERAPGRLLTLARLVRRWGSENVRVVGATALSPPLKDPLGAILLDAPCSGLGTLAHHPDIRWRARPEDLPRHAERQRALLSSASSLLAPGGGLVYATCSLEPEENEGVLEPFLEEHRDFHPLPLPAWAAPFQSGPFARVLPEAFGGDGFFIALLGRG
jgi:16S rRNA (cytosine967-C5)-methyltransferase